VSTVMSRSPVCPSASRSPGTPEDLAMRKQTRKLVMAALAAMTESLRSVVVLYDLEDMDTHEIAEALGIPRGTVESRLRRARLQLRRSLAAIELAWDLDIMG